MDLKKEPISNVRLFKGPRGNKTVVPTVCSNPPPQKKPFETTVHVAKYFRLGDQRILLCICGTSLLDSVLAFTLGDLMVVLFELAVTVTLLEFFAITDVANSLAGIYSMHSSVKTLDLKFFAIILFFNITDDAYSLL